MESPLEHQGSNPAGILILDYWSLEAWGNKSLLFKAIWFVALCHHTPSKILWGAPLLFCTSMPVPTRFLLFEGFSPLLLTRTLFFPLMLTRTLLFTGSPGQKRSAQTPWTLPKKAIPYPSLLTCMTNYLFFLFVF